METAYRDTKEGVTVVLIYKTLQSGIKFLLGLIAPPLAFDSILVKLLSYNCMNCVIIQAYH